jgi:high-affinity Fe2+/Pb2+ permease
LSAYTFHLFSFYAIVAGWTACAAIFILQRKRTRDGTKRSDRASVIGLALQSVAFALVWLGDRHPRLSVFAFGRWFEFLLLVIAVTLLIGSLWVCSAAVRVLGKQ